MSTSTSVSQALHHHQHHHHHHRQAERRVQSSRVESVSQTQKSSRRVASARYASGLKASMHSFGGAEEEVTLRPLPQKLKPFCLAVDENTEIIGYVVPAFRTRHALVREEAETAEESMGRIAMRQFFSQHAESMEVTKVEKKSRQIVLREFAETMTLKRKMLEKEEFERKMNKDSLTHHSEFVVRPKNYTVWEGQNVILHCTLAGWPKPRVTWYKNNVCIDPKAHPEKYTVESMYNLHSLEIKNCVFEDTALYTASALNIKGETSAVSSVVVKRYKEEDLYLGKPHGFSPEYGVTFMVHLMDKFSVSFGIEGQTLSLGCSAVVYPTVKRYQPDVLWYRNNTLLKPSKWVAMSFTGGRASLTLTHLNKEDEGLYTMRVNTKSGYNSHSAFVFVRDAGVEVEGVPVAPLDVRCQDVNKDYVVVTWKHPAVEGASPILGYFVDRRELGSTHWAQCNDTPVKFARFPVTGLVEARTYSFRVSAVNHFGISVPSRASEPVVALDPSDRVRRGHPLAPWTAQIIVTEEDPSAGIIPGPPSDLAVTEATKSYVVLSWNPPGQRGHEGLMYYVEKLISGMETWQRVNTELPVRSPRFALFDLAEGRAYSFRVRCANSAGVGEPSEATPDITVGDKLELPQAPSNVVPIRLTDTAMVVTWKRIEEIEDFLGYYIEYNVVGSTVWSPCNNKPVRGSRFVCHGLSEGDTCVFKVKAVNVAGYSLSSQESEKVLVKAGISVTDPPPVVRVQESFRDYKVLTWDEPQFNGGAEVTGYFLDLRPIKAGVKGQWHELNTKEVKERSFKVEDLKENVFYEFRVCAINQAGVSDFSHPCTPNECKEYTITVPGTPHGLHVLEVRSNSVVLLWQPPVYQGRSPVTGYYVDIKEADAPEGAWRGVNETATTKTFMQVEHLKEGVSYALRVCAQNLAGVGAPAEMAESVLAQTRPGTHEIYVDVDDDGVISMIFECPDMSPDSQFVWSKDYVQTLDPSRLKIETSPGRTRAIFSDPSLDDLGIYSCVVTNTDGISSSYTLTEEGLKRLLDISHDHKFPKIPFTSELAVELQEKGRVRLWMQLEKFTPNCEVEYVFNENIITPGSKYTMNFDKKTGIIELFMDSLEVSDEGTFTFNLVDGKATGCSSIVLIGDEFKEMQKKSEFARKEWVRKQGPHFVEYLTFEVTPECDVLLKAKVANLSKETDITWYKDGLEIEDQGNLSFKDGVLALNIAKYGFKKRERGSDSESDDMESIPEKENPEPEAKITKKDAGIYELQLKDSRGKDKSTLDLTGKGYQDVMNAVFKVIANSASELSVTSTEEGIILHTTVIHYLEDLRVTWLYRDSKITQSKHLEAGVTGEQLWLKINEPTEKDKGKYAIDIFDGQAGVRRAYELAGQAWEEAFAEFQRLKAAAIAERNRARVVGGLPDVVTIQEGKSLNLTGNVWGDPAPQVKWMKNEKDITSDDRYTLKFEGGKFASITISAVTPPDSGKYSLVVSNKYGTEMGNFTVSVYIPEGEEQEPEAEAEVEAEAGAREEKEPVKEEEKEPVKQEGKVVRKVVRRVRK